MNNETSAPAAGRADAPAPGGGPTLYERLGAMTTIDVAVNEFYARVLLDPGLRPFFLAADLEALKEGQKRFLAQALGGPAGYEGPEMRRAHAHLPIEEKHFQRVLGHLAKTLEALEISPELIAEVVELLSPSWGKS